MTLLPYQTVQSMAQSIAKGNEIPGYYLIQKFGSNSAVGTTYVPVTDGGIYMMPQAAGAKALRIRGGDAADAATGAGARLVTLQGLDDSFENSFENLITNGTSASDPSSKLYTRLPRAFIPPLGSGTYATVTPLAGSHAAAIIIEDTDGNEWGRINATGFPYATTEIAAYSIAANEIGYLVHGDIFTDAVRTTDALMYTRENINQTEAPYSPMKVFKPFKLQGGQLILDFGLAPFAIRGPADTGLLAKVDSGVATVAAGFDLLIQRLRPDAGKTHRESPPGV